MDARAIEIIELQEQGLSFLEIANKYSKAKTDKNKRDWLRKYMKKKGYKVIDNKFVKETTENQIKLTGMDIKLSNANKKVLDDAHTLDLDKKEMFTRGEVEQLKEIIHMKDKLKEVIQKYKDDVLKQEENINNNLDIDLSLFDGEVKNRVVKVYNNVNEDWKELSENWRQYRQQDLISLALYEFIQKYKK